MRWILVLALLGCALVARTDFDYDLQPRQIADDAWLLEGSTECNETTHGNSPKCEQSRSDAFLVPFSLREKVARSAG